ncbi:hypothetical protein DV735_g1960, partial [Chaetothyriales sp. CBS 134920]
MRSAERPSTRTIVRWNDDLDKSILLFINYACSEAGIKLPFARVAELMGPRFTEGAIVQHIAKVRNKMQDEKEKSNPDLLVPPPNKRSSVPKASSAMSYENSRQRKSIDFPDLVCNPTIKSNRVKVKRGLEESDDDNDGDNEWVGKETSAAKKPKKVSPKQKHNALTPDYLMLQSMTDSSAEDACSPTPTLAGPRRRIKVNYAGVVDGVSDNEESGTENLIQHGEKPSRNAGLSAPNPTPSHTVIPPNGHALSRNSYYPTTYEMDYPTLDMANIGLMPPFAMGAGGFGGLPWLPGQHEIHPFTDFGFNGSGISANAPFAPDMRTGIPALGGGGLNHGLTPMVQTSNNSNNSVGTNSSVSAHQNFPALHTANQEYPSWDPMKPIDDQLLPSPNFSDFVNLDGNTVG